MGNPREGSSCGNPRPRAVPALLIRGHEIPLDVGDTVIGRGGDSDISILGALVSRRHARVVNVGERITIEDLASKNGVFVNGARIEVPTPLRDGDTVLIGTMEITFFLGSPDLPPSQGQVAFDEHGNFLADGGATQPREVSTLVRFEAEQAVAVLELDREDITVQGSRPPPPKLDSGLIVREERPMPVSPSAIDPVHKRETDQAMPVSAALPKLQPSRARASEEPPSSRSRTDTAQRSGDDPLVTVLAVVGRMLSRGDIDAAARALSPQITKRIQAARAGRPIPQLVLEPSALFCLDLFDSTGDPAWFDAAVDLYSVAKRPMPPAVLDRAGKVLPAMPSSCRERFGGYQKVVRALLSEVDVEELEDCERVLELKW